MWSFHRVTLSMGYTGASRKSPNELPNQKTSKIGQLPHHPLQRLSGRGKVIPIINYLRLSPASFVEEGLFVVSAQLPQHHSSLAVPPLFWQRELSLQLPNRRDKRMSHED